MAPSITTRSRTLKIATALGLTILILGCDGSDRGTPLSPFPPALATPSPTPAPPPTPIGQSVLSGAAFEMTLTGRSPVEGATIYLTTCGTFNCPDAKGYETKTDKEGSYRIAGVYDGALNFLWISKEDYALVDPMAPGTCPDGCDRLVTVKGETRLDLELVDDRGAEV